MSERFNIDAIFDRRRFCVAVVSTWSIYLQCKMATNWYAPMNTQIWHSSFR